MSTPNSASGEDSAVTVDVEERVDDSVEDYDAEAGDTPVEDAPESLVAELESTSSWPQRAGLGLAVLALILAGLAGYFKWQGDSVSASAAAATDAIHAASDSTVALLSYHAESVDADLTAASDRLTGGFRDEYTRLVNTVVAPGAKQKHISAVATVPAAAAVSATQNHAVVLVFVNQTTSIGNDTPTGSTSSVRVTLDKVHDRWLISQFDPV